MFTELWRDFNENELAALESMTDDELLALKERCSREEKKRDTNQQNRKILINSLYGALGQNGFRYYDRRNAEAVTSFGQLAIRWIERKINEYLNASLKTDGYDFVRYIDTDSVYVCLEKLIEHVGEDKFRDINHVVDFLDKFAKGKMEPMIDESYKELEAYMNSTEHLLLMDREAIACAPFGSGAAGGFWTGKKRYALNVYDMEGTRYAEPKLKIMGLETQRSSTPLACRASLKEGIRRIVQEGEASLQEYYRDFQAKHRELHYLEIAPVSTANNLAQYTDPQGYPRSKTPYHVKGAQAFNRYIKAKGFATVSPIMEGEKVMHLPLKQGNPFGELVISWPSGTKIPVELESTVLEWMDRPTLFKKTFTKPLDKMGSVANMCYEKRASLMDFFDI